MELQDVKVGVFSTLSFPVSVMETCSVVLTFESADEILWCYHSSETSLAVLLLPFVFQYLTKLNLGFFLNFDIGQS